MSNFSSMLKEFAEAQKAIEQVPILRDEVRAKSEENLRLESARIELTMALQLARANIINLQAQIARLEVERDDASFREMVTADKLNILQSKIGALAGLAQELKLESEQTVTEGEAPTETLSAAPMESQPPAEGQSATDPTVDTTQHPEQVSVDPIGAEPCMSAGYRLDSRADETITQPYTGEPSPIDPGLGFMRPTPKPYEGQEAWQKPYGVSWDDFVSGGGEAPSWYVKPTMEGKF